MRSHDLRIGNIVDAIHIDYGRKTNVIDIDDLVLIYEGSEYLSFHPVQLTKEWLVRFGFDKHGKIKSTKFLFRIYFDEETPYAYLETYGGGEYKIEIKYVHQLQNLYWGLCGEELTLQNINSENTNKQD